METPTHTFQNLQAEERFVAKFLLDHYERVYEGLNVTEYYEVLNYLNDESCWHDVFYCAEELLGVDINKFFWFEQSGDLVINEPKNERPPADFKDIVDIRNSMLRTIEELRIINDNIFAGISNDYRYPLVITVQIPELTD